MGILTGHDTKPCCHMGHLYCREQVEVDLKADMMMGELERLSSSVPTEYCSRMVETCLSTDYNKMLAEFKGKTMW